LSNIVEFANIPDIAFNEGLDYSTLDSKLLAQYLAAGGTVELGSADPRRHLLMVMAYFGAHLGAVIDATAKAGLLKYATGAQLDNLGAMKRTLRRQAVAASARLRFSMAAPRSSATPIPGGTRVTNGAGVYFATDTYTEIPAGETAVEVDASATVAGAEANGCAAGSLKTIVDLVPYVPDVTNLEPSAGGADIQNDDDYTRAIYNAPAAYSVAGPTEAYEYHARQSRADIEEVRAYTPQPGHVNVVFTLNGGVLPGEADCADMAAYLSEDTIRPLTDNVHAMAPHTLRYNISMTYYIESGNAAQAVAIQAAVNAAVQAYIVWQRRIGRDITPSKLIQLVMAAGAKRVSVLAPQYTKVTEYDLAVCGEQGVIYGGLEDD